MTAPTDLQRIIEHHRLLELEWDRWEEAGWPVLRYRAPWVAQPDWEQALLGDSTVVGAP